MSASSLRAALLVDGAARAIDVTLADGVLAGTLDGAAVSAEATLVGPGEVVLRVGGRRVRAVVAKRGATLLVSVEGRTHEVARADAAMGTSPAARVEPFAASPMTGLLAKVHVAPGEAVAKGRPLFAVEAMKMEYVVTADRDVVVSEVRRRAGDRVSIGEPIVAFR